MKKLSLYILPFFFLGLVSCKKNPLPPDDSQTGSPVFYFKGEVNGVSIPNIEAGVNGYYMYSSHFQDANNVYVYKADLKQSSCTNNCNYAISVLINDFKASSPNAAMLPDSGLFIGKHEFNDGDVPPLYFNGIFTPSFPGGSLNGYTWTYNNGIDPAVTQAVFPGNYKFNNKQTYSVGLVILTAMGTATHTNIFKIGSPLQANVSAHSDPPFTFSYTALATESVSTYYWEFGDGNHTPINNPNSSVSHPFSNNPEQYYTTKLTLSNATDTCVSYYQIPAFSNTLIPHANYTNSFTPIPNTKALSAITILLTDPSGNVYSSGSLNQATNNNFEIVSVEEYKVNQSNEKTKKVKIKFNCTVKNGTNTINITNGEAVIAVSYN